MPRNARAPISLLLLAPTPDISVWDIFADWAGLKETGLREAQVTSLCPSCSRIRSGLREESCWQAAPLTPNER